MKFPKIFVRRMKFPQKVVLFGPRQTLFPTSEGEEIKHW